MRGSTGGEAPWGSWSRLSRQADFWGSDLEDPREGAPAWVKACRAFLRPGRVGRQGTLRSSQTWGPLNAFESFETMISCGML